MSQFLGALVTSLRSLGLLAVSVCLALAMPVHAKQPKEPQWGFDVDLSEVRTIDGSGNSIGGAAATPLLRIAPADYPGDGSGTDIIEFPDRENPRVISNRIADQAGGSILNSRGVSDYLWAWGQFVDHDIDLTDGNVANGIADIPVEELDDPLGPGPILFTRSNFTGSPRQQINAITAFIDASNVYGSDAVRAAALRAFSGGRLITSAGNLLPFNTGGLPNAGGPSASLFLAGDVRANENVMLTSLHTLFVREHNRLAAMIQLLSPDAADEQIYQLARKIVGAEMQIITYGEFLPALLGPAAPALESLGFSASVDAGIANEFSTAFYRFGHSLLSPQLMLSGAGAGTSVLPLRDAFFQPAFLANQPSNVDRLLIGSCVQLSQNVDNKIVDDVRNFLFGPPGAGGLDLASLNIQRGRDHGLADYHTIRQAYGLPALSGIADVSSDAGVVSALSDLYGDIDNIDAWVGGLAEDHLSGSSVGALISAAMSDQFSRLLSGDRFSVLNDADLADPIVKAAIDLNNVTLANVIRANTTARLLPDVAFFVDGATDSDVIVTYDGDENRLHVTGNADPNLLVMMEMPFGVVFTGLGTTTINGEAAVTIATDPSPHVTIDLGGGADSCYALTCTFGDCVVALGDGDDELFGMHSHAERLAVDGGPGHDKFNNGGIKTPKNASRTHNLP